LWESFSNGKELNEKGQLVNRIAAGDPAFNQRVLMFLQGQSVTDPLPNGYKDYIAPTGPGITANLFNNGRTDQTQLFIFTPFLPGTKTLKYEARYGLNGEVKDTIATILGNRAKAIMVPYTPLDSLDAAESAQLGTDARGNVLFQYDPNSDGNGKKAWRLFMENRIESRNV
jgi:hypothetical protein